MRNSFTAAVEVLQGKNCLELPHDHHGNRLGLYHVHDTHHEGHRDRMAGRPYCKNGGGSLDCFPPHRRRGHSYQSQYNRPCWHHLDLAEQTLHFLVHWG